MNPRARASTVVVAVSVSLVVLSSCSTTYDSSLSTTESTAVTTTTVPTGLPRDLLTQLIESTRTLSRAVTNGDRESAKAHLSDIEAQWSALKPQIVDSAADVAVDIQRIVDLAISAVTRNRPADADKALLLLPIISSAFAASVAGGS